MPFVVIKTPGHSISRKGRIYFGSQSEGTSEEVMVAELVAANWPQWVHSQRLTLKRGGSFPSGMFPILRPSLMYFLEK